MWWSLLATVSCGVIFVGWYIRQIWSTSNPELFYEMCEYYYRFNEKYRVTDRRIRMQSRRFDWVRMMETVKRSVTEPPNLDAYTIGEKSTGIFPEWNTDHEILGDMCDWLVKCATFYLREANPMDRRKRCLAVLDDFVRRYARAMEGKFDIVFPWGKNWYQFSISSTLMLFYYILVAEAANKRFAADLILRIVITPKKSLGRARDQANSIYMGLPWIIAHYIKGTVNSAAEHPDYKYVVEYIKFPMVEKRKQEGLYIDYTYITHTNVLAYGYLANMTSMSLPIVSFDNAMRNFMLDWTRCKRILAHPTIPYGPIGMYTRSPVLKSFTQSDSRVGVEVIPTCLFIRMYGEDYSFACRGQNEWIAYYESDKVNDDMAQYWVLGRRVYFKGEDYKPTFPDVGFEYPKYLDHAQTQLVTRRCRIPTKTTTTTPFVPGAWVGGDQNAPLKQGCVFAFRNMGLLRHNCYCIEMKYGETGEHMFEEFILCDSDKHTIDIWRRIYRMNPGVEPYLLFAEKTIEWPVGRDAKGLWHLHWNCKTRKLTSSFEPDYNKAINEVYPPGITLVNTEDTVILFEHGKPKIAMYPEKWTDMNTTFTTKVEGKEYEFVFDVLTNQYWLAGLCIDR